MALACPFCNRTFSLFPDLERHANQHFVVEEELERDEQLASQSGWSTSPNKGTDAKARDYVESTQLIEDRTDCSGTDIKEQIDVLVHCQLRTNVYRFEYGLMTLLKRCLGLEKGRLNCVISGHVDHFKSLKGEDSGWGCGWRNIQMLSSYLLKEREEARNVLFGGVGFVPDIASLQRWLEIAWEMGFDVPGSETFDKKIYGKNSWIGTTECAALLRSFGLRARIVDFGSKSVKAAGRKQKNRKRNNGPAYGPMDKYLYSESCNNLQTNTTSENHIESNCKSMRIDGQQFLAEWVWNYFSEKTLSDIYEAENIIVSGKTPLYFQHDGHSRTIVGIQRIAGADRMLHDYSLLILDPGHVTENLEKSLQNNYGWQKLFKRGVHTLRKPQYQLCYVDSGIASGAELEQLKTIDSVFFEVDEKGKRVPQ